MHAKRSVAAILAAFLAATAPCGLARASDKLHDKLTQIADAELTKITGECSAYTRGEEQRYFFSHTLEGNSLPSVYLLVGVACDYAAYNASYRWFTIDTYGDLRNLAFAQPDIAVDYADDEDTEVKSMKIRGYYATLLVSNSDFDLEKLEIAATHKWRGIGDVSHTAIWRFINGDFLLQSFDVDATYDGKINPRPLIRLPQ